MKKAATVSTCVALPDKHYLDYKIRFNLPHVAGTELDNLRDVIERKHFAGKGVYTHNCHSLLEQRCGFHKVLLTPSCSDALEMCAILSEIKPGDEVLIPSYTFVSTANAFALRGAQIRYVDSSASHPNAGLQEFERAISPKTKVVVVVHYGGYALDIEDIAKLCKERNILMVEDAACALDSSVNGKFLGSFGDLATFSFHETKNVTSGKGGLLVINNPELVDRALIVWEKGTNRSAFFKGQVDKYGWVDFGSSYLNSEVMAAFLYAQLQQLDEVRKHRRSIWNTYKEQLIDLGIQQSTISEGTEYNYHMYFLIMPDEKSRDQLISGLAQRGIQAVFHYQALSESAFSKSLYGEQDCPQSRYFEERLLRLPFHSQMTVDDAIEVARAVKEIMSQQQV